MNRRSFLGKVIKSFFTIITAAFSFFLLIFLYPFRLKKKKIWFFEIFDEDSLPKRGVKKVEIEYINKGKKIATQAFVANHNGQIYAFSPICTHLGCLVHWNRHKNSFLCACHGGKYDINGIVVSGPPPKPLTKLPLKLENGKVYIGLKV